MNKSVKQRWLRAAILVAIVYPVVGLTFAALVNPYTSNAMRLTSRLAAWLVSVAAFAAHLWYEHFRLRNSALSAALHTSYAVALGAFALAIWVNIYTQWAALGHQRPLAPLALVVFPVVTGLPAFVVAFVAGVVLARTRPRS